MKINLTPSLRGRLEWLANLGAAWLFALLYIIINQIVDSDLWGRLSIGALLAQTGKFPYHDVFSFTAPHALWVDHEWLTGVVLYQVMAAFGEPGLMLFKYLLIFGVILAPFLLHRYVYRTAPWITLALTAAMVNIYSCEFYTTIRSHIFSFLFFGFFILALEATRLWNPSRRLMSAILGLLVGIGIVWGNFHGGFIMGIILLILYGVGAMLSRLSVRPALPYLTAAAAIFIGLGFLNPYGPDYWGFLIHAWTLDRSHIGEWNPLQINNVGFIEVQVLIVLLLLGLLIRFAGDLQCRKLAGNDPQQAAYPESLRAIAAPVLVILMMVFMSMRGVRFQGFLAFAAISYIPVLFPPTFWKLLYPQAIVGRLSGYVPLIRNLLPGVLLVGSLVGLVYIPFHSIPLLSVTMDDDMTLKQEVPLRYPLAAIASLRASQLHGNLVVIFNLGEFAYWALYPRFKVSMDGRYEEVYSQTEFLRNYHFYDRHHLMNSQKNTTGIENTNADFILTEPTIGGTAMLAKNPAWELLNGNQYFVLFGKKSTLAKQPPYKVQGSAFAIKRYTIQDFFHPEDLKRFATPKP